MLKFARAGDVQCCHSRYYHQDYFKNHHHNSYWSSISYIFFFHWNTSMKEKQPLCKSMVIVHIWIYWYFSYTEHKGMLNLIINILLISAAHFTFIMIQNNEPGSRKADFWSEYGIFNIINICFMHSLCINIIKY